MPLRIISGERRGAIIQTPEGQETRPLRDRLRQSLFNILRPDLRGVRVLDAFAGSGAVGLEALSNGASHATFVESWPTAAGAIRKNITKLRYEGRTLLLEGKSPAVIAKADGPFDLLFLMPPYHSALCDAVLADAEVLRRCAPGALAACEIHADETLAPHAPWVAEDERLYGITKLVFLRKP